VIKINDYLLQVYIDKIEKEDINNFAKKQGIILEENELDTVYTYLKQHWRTFYYGNPKEILNELKTKLSETTYNKIEQLYKQLKEKID